MAILKQKEIINMSPEELKKKLAELKLEKMKAPKSGQGTSIKTREVKRTIARILTHINTKNYGNMS